MEAAGAAVGVASLGIQICQGLLRYYHDWRSFSDDIQSACDKVSGLEWTFALLKASLDEPCLDTKRTVRVQECLLAGQRSLTRLRELYEQLQPERQLSKVTGRAAFAVKRALYPFRTNTLEKITESASTLISELSLAVQTLQLDLEAASHSNIAAVDDKLQSVLDGLTHIETRARAWEGKIEVVNLATQKKVSSIDVQLQSLSTKLDAAQQDRERLLSATGGISLGMSKNTGVVTQNLQHIHAQLSDFKFQLEAATSAQNANINDYRVVMGWLSRHTSSDPLSDHETARGKCVPNTGKWILDFTEYQRWKISGPHLWIHGKVGCGKTILCSTIIEDLRSTHNQDPPKLVYFYFTFTNTGQELYSSLLSAIIQQLCQQDSLCAYELLKEKYYEKQSLSRGLLEEILFIAMREHHEVFLVVDGVDEISDDATKMMVLDLLEKLVNSSLNVKILIVSRQQAEIEATANHIAAIQLPLNKASINQDIRSYVTSQFAKDVRLRRWNPDLKAKVQTTFEHKADGMFRWAYCQLEVLKKIRSTREANIKNALLGLPVTLDETYERILTRIPDSDRMEALCLLRWLTFASRPLTLDELQESRRLVELNGEDSNAWNDAGSVQDIVEILADLVYVDPIPAACHDVAVDAAGRSDTASQGTGADETEPGIKSPRIQLAHSSVRDYLLSIRILQSTASYFALQSGPTHIYLARSCIAYFKQYNSSDLRTHTQDDYQTFPLLDYAAVCWSDHMMEDHSSASAPGAEQVAHEDRLAPQAITPSQGQHDRSKRFLSLLRGKLFHVPSRHLQHVSDIDRRPWRKPPRPDGSALYHACRLGRRASAMILIEHGANVNAHGGEDCLAIAVALHHGHRNIFTILLEADVHLASACGKWNSLKWSVYHGFVRETRLLMQMYTSERSKLRDFPKALDIAAARGHLAIVKMFIAAGVDLSSHHRKAHVSCPNGYKDASPLQGTRVEHHQALAAAALQGHTKVVDALVEAGAQLGDTIRDKHYAHTGPVETLALAAEQNDGGTITSLMTTGVDVNAGRSSPWGTVLYIAADHGNQNTLRALLEAGADINAKGGLSGSALRVACHRGQYETVKLLLAGGACPNVTSDDARTGTALEAASMHGSIDIVQALIDAGAALDSPGMFYGTALEAALHHGQSDTADILVGAGADTRAIAGNCNAMFSAAIHGGLLDYAAQFLDDGADVNTKVLGKPPLHFAASAGSVETVRLLLNAGVKVNAFHQFHGTALFAACLNGHTSIVDILIQAGANMEVKVHGKTALQAMYSQGTARRRITKLLLSAGADSTPGNDLVLQRERSYMSERTDQRSLQPREAEASTVDPSTVSQPQAQDLCE